MINIIWIMNKYVDGKSLSRYYPDFLRNVEKQIEESGNKISFVFFSNAMKSKIRTKNNYFYNQNKKHFGKNIQKMANDIESKYGFTFKQSYFPDQIQVSKTQDYRKIHLPENEFFNLDFLVSRFLYIEDIIENKKVDVVFCDQSPEAEMEFARAICLKKKKIFLRQSESFLGRCVFYQQSEFGKERVVLPIIDDKITQQYAKDFVEDFIENNRLPYLPRPYLQMDVKEYYLPRLIHFYCYPQYIKLALMAPYLFLEEKILKPLIEDKFDITKPYFFIGFHLPTESTVALRSLPYMTQTSLIENISRVLPYGHYLYVREHPSWRKHFPYSYLKRIKKLPCVRLISPKIPISEIIKHSRGILTYNATTGIESLMYGKPVLSFAPNVYYKLHPSVDYCSDLFELGSKLAKLVNTKVNKDDTYQYVFKLMRSTSKIALNAGTFLSESESVQKAKIFTRELLSAIKYCNENKKL